MPFAPSSAGEYDYGDTHFFEVECGGGGNCLFLSLAWLLNHYQVPGGPYTHGGLRQQASVDLLGWARGDHGMEVQWTHEGSVENVADHQLSDLDATTLANPRVYGEMGAVFAVVARLKQAGRDVEVHVLDGTDMTANVIRSTNAIGAPAFKIHLYFLSYVHYRALVPQARLAAVPPLQVIANFGDVFAGGTGKGKGTVSLQSGKQKSKTSTLKIPAGTVLEIHHIDVGQADATLVLIKDADETVHFSMLIDAGAVQGSVSGYFDQLIKGGNFRPLDAIILSHPDKDHIADALGLVRNARYVSPMALLYDNGTPPEYDSPYDQWIRKDANPLWSRRRRPPLDRPIVHDFLGVKIEVLSCNGVERREKGFYCENAGGLLETGKWGNYVPEKEVQMEQYLYPSGGDSKNDYSIATLISFGQFLYFSAGDLSGAYEERVAEWVNVNYGPVTVWKAGHHGAQGCSSPSVVGALQGRFCVFSFGTNNGHGHPHQAAIDHIESLNGLGCPCTYYCTGTAQALPQNLAKPGVLGTNGRDGCGTIIVRAAEADVVKKRALPRLDGKIPMGSFGSRARRCAHPGQHPRRHSVGQPRQSLEATDRRPESCQQAAQIRSAKG